MEIQQTRTKGEIVSNAKVMLETIMKRQEEKINKLVREEAREDEIDLLKLLHIVKLLLTLNQ